MMNKNTEAKSTENNQKKRRKFKRNFALDIFVISLCIAGTFTAAYFFLQNINTALTNVWYQSAGIVESKKNYARQYLQGRLWEGLRAGDDVYSGGKIRTGEMSELTIVFNSNDILDLPEESFVEIFFTEQEKGITLFSGAASIIAKNNLVLKSGGTSVAIGEGSVLNAFVKDDMSDASNFSTLHISLVEGHAQIQTSKSIKEIYAPCTITVNSYGEIKSASAITVISPKPNTKIISSSPLGAKVPFEWHKENAAINDYVCIEIATDMRFNNIVKTINESSAGTALLDLACDVYYWRSYLTNDASGNEIN
ncbi:MAG: hypothetical protein LBV52_06730, partial [Spirochaetaceae bacterium]|nr:hypothetical protein [Spirochaetaceae bacterium]